MSIRRIVPLLSLALAGSAAACALPRMGEDITPHPPVVRAAELRATGAADLFGALARARPGWIGLAGDTASARSLERVLVYVDGVYTGTLGLLRGMPYEEVTSVRLRSEMFVRTYASRIPEQPFVAALYVWRATEPAALRQRRWTGSVSGAVELLETSGRVEQSLADAGFTERAGAGNRWFTEEVNTPTLVLGGSITHLRPSGWGVQAGAAHMLPTRAQAVHPGTLQAVSGEVTATEGALMAVRSLGVIRLGLGPAVRMLRIDWSEGFCACRDPDSVSSTALGLAAEAIATVPIGGSYLFESGLRLRHYPSQEAGPYGDHFESLDAGGTIAWVGVGFGIRF